MKTLRSDKHHVPAQELLPYLVCGAATTAVNYIMYGILLLLHIPWAASNSAAWAGAVLTAYLLNRRWVFRSGGRILPELTAFAGARFLTLLAESGLLFLLIRVLRTAPLPAKLAVSGITVAGNYVLCKYGIFQKKEAKSHE